MGVGIKGNLTRMNEIPFQALAAKNSIWGSGMTSEGTYSRSTFLLTADRSFVREYCRMLSFFSRGQVSTRIQRYMTSSMGRIGVKSPCLAFQNTLSLVHTVGMV
jgi:hypothetical protein